MRIVLFTLVFPVWLATSTPVHADADTERLILSLCEFTKANDRSNLRKKLKTADLQLRRIYGGILCDGMSMLRFAVTNNAGEAVEFIASQLGKDALNTPEKDGKTILQWTEVQADKKPMLDILLSTQ